MPKSRGQRAAWPPLGETPRMKLTGAFRRLMATSVRSLPAAHPRSLEYWQKKLGLVAMKMVSERITSWRFFFI